MTNSTIGRLPPRPTAAGKNKRRLMIVFVLTAGYLIAEVVGGLMTNSLALLADAGHMLTDVGGLGFALLAIRFAEKPPTPARTYGYYRAEILAALANSVVLIVVSLYILFEAYQRFRNPPEIASTAVLWIGSIGMAVNIAGMLILREGAKDSLNMRGAYFEVLSDLLTSIGVIIAAVIMMTTGWYYADPIVSALIGLLILPRTWKLLKDAVGILLEGTPHDVDFAALRRTIESTPGVRGVHDLHVWALTSGTNAMSVHLVVDASEPYHEVIRAVQDRVAASHPIGHQTVQIEPAGWERSEVHL